MSAEELLNDDITPIKPLVKPQPNYYQLTSLRLEAGARLARAIKTLKDANVFGDDNDVNTTSMQNKALEIAEANWANICNGLTPVLDSHGRESLRDNLPACIEAFRVVVMEYAQREALELECRNMITHTGGFKLLMQKQVLHLEAPHICDGDCNHD